MGLFTRKKKSASVSSSPASTTSTALPSPYLAPVELALRVALDPVPLDPSEDELFYIEVNPDEQVSEIRKAISRRLGDVSMSLFKVSVSERATLIGRCRFRGKRRSRRGRIPPATASGLTSSHRFPPFVWTTLRSSRPVSDLPAGRQQSRPPTPSRTGSL
jgi:hypothetical protein